MFQSEKPRRNPRTQLLNEVMVELSGGLPALFTFANPGGIKISPVFISVNIPNYLGGGIPL
jgi:hypothetical protein